MYDEVRFAGIDGRYHCMVYFMAARQHFGRAEVVCGSGVVMAVCDKDKMCKAWGLLGSGLLGNSCNCTAARFFACINRNESIQTQCCQINAAFLVYNIL